MSDRTRFLPDDWGYDVWHQLMRDRVETAHRYCVCQPGYRRTPHLPWQCDFCLRRINERYDDRIPHEATT